MNFIRTFSDFLLVCIRMYVNRMLVVCIRMYPYDQIKQ